MKSFAWSMGLTYVKIKKIYSYVFVESHFENEKLVFLEKKIIKSEIKSKFSIETYKTGHISIRLGKAHLLRPSGNFFDPGFRS